MSVASIGRREMVGISLGCFAAVVARVRPSKADARVGDPVPVVASFDEALLAAMRAGRGTSFAQRFAAMAVAVDRAFDLPAILRVSVGAHWSAIPANQQTALASAFRGYTIANFVANFDSYSGQKIEILPAPRSLPSGDQVVTTQIVAPSDSARVLAYVVRGMETEWRIVDVLADGSISRVATQRSDFRALLASGGGSALLASLQSKVAALSGGAIA